MNRKKPGKKSAKVGQKSGKSVAVSEKSDAISEKGLNPQQVRFCEEYLIDLNGTQAAVRAGYSEHTATEQASRLLTNVKVKEKVKILMDARSERAKVNADQVLSELSRIGYTDVRAIFKEDGAIKDPKDWPEDLARAIASIEVVEEFKGYGINREWIGYTKKVKFWDKPKALELLGRHKGQFPNKVEVSGKITLEEMIAGSNEEKKKNG